MYRFQLKSNLAATAAIILICLALLPGVAAARGKDKDKKKETAPEPKPNILEVLDKSKIVWPNPPAITRVKYLNYFSGEKYQPKQKKKSGWMDLLSGVATGESLADQKLRFQLVAPYGMAVDSKGLVYIADSKVGAVFIVDPETNGFTLIGNGIQARFKVVTGIAIDDADHLFVSDSAMRRVLVFNPRHQVEGSISDGMADPGGMAIDDENRFLYVCDAELDQVLVYDADPPYRLLRRIGTGGKKHTLTTPGDFARPTNVAVDGDGNLYVSDTMNFRVEVFDADGNFIRTWGKAGDAPGYFARPKGIAIDSDGQVWVADEVQDRLQLFTPEGRLLMWMGGHGLLPGQFGALVGVAVDRKTNRVFTTEQYPGRMQMFRYFTNGEALAEKKKRDEEEAKKVASRAAPAEKPKETSNPFAAARAGKSAEPNGEDSPKP